jgi:DNA-binding transcriptional MerR regulator
VNGPATIASLAHRHRITTRQIEYWLDRGYLQVPATGHGNARLIPEDEQAVLEVMVRLTRAGLRHEPAADAARTLAATPGPFRLPGGVEIAVPPADSETETAL